MRKLFLLFLVLFSSLLFPKEFDITYITNNNGLSNSSITKILQDSNRLFWMGSWDGLNLYNGREFEIFKPEPGNTKSISNNIIRDIIEENSNNIWITTDRGINRLNLKSRVFDRFFSKNLQNRTYNENSFFVSINSHDEIFAWVNDLGLHYYDKNLNDFISIKTELNVDVSSLFFDQQNTLWVLSKQGELSKIFFKTINNRPIVAHITPFKYLKNIRFIYYHKPNEVWMQDISNRWFMFRISDNNFSEFTSPLFNQAIKAISIQKNYQLWGTEKGLYRFDPKTNSVEQLLTNTSILSIFSGTQNIIWVGTDNHGVIQLSPSREKFRSYTQNNTPSIGNSAIRSFIKDNRGILWVGSKGNGITGLRLNKNIHQALPYRNITTKEGLLSNSIFTLRKGGNGEIWIGTDGCGINYLDPINYTIKTLSINKQIKGKINLCSVYSIFFTDINTMWVGTSGNGLYKLIIDYSTTPYSIKYFKQFTSNSSKNSISNNIVYSIIRADKDHLWIGTRGGGLNLFNLKSEQFKAFSFAQNNPYFMSCDDILALYKDHKNYLWVGSSMGLIKLFSIDKGQPRFTRYTEENGMPNNTIHGILEDHKNNIWVSTNKGIAKIITKNSKPPRIVSYFDKDGLQNNEFSDGAFYESDSLFFFGGIMGFNTFNPSEISSNKDMPFLFLDEFFVDNKKENLSDYILNHKNRNNRLELSYRNKSFSFKFVPIDYISGEKCEISYQLVGYQKDWINLGTSTTMVFSNLPSGNYTLKVRCSNSEKIWTKQIYELPIYMAPPWWATNVAYICYFFLILILAYAIIKLIQYKKRVNLEIKNKELEQQKSEEIHQAKLRFFTNIAHEFSNSLTLIYGPCIQLLKNISGDDIARRQVNTIKSNAERMQRLIQQLIEFRKAETGFLKLNYQNIDIIEVTGLVIDKFTDRIEQKNIRFSFNPKHRSIYWLTDMDCIEKIVFNLLSNAVKYTPVGERINLELITENDNLLIKISNFGVGINHQHKNDIFNRFEVLNRLEREVSQGIDTSNGIGLALCKNIAEVLNGEISLESDGESFTTFIVSLPMIREMESNLQSHQIDDTHLEKESSLVNSGSQNIGFYIPDDKKEGLILVIDDEPEIRILINESLSEKYEIVEAINGKVALEIINQRLPQLIICDIIMPEMNGIEFVTLMKKQKQTRHVPIIILSSKATIENQIEGLEIGADAYLGKPFHPKHLDALIHSLLHRNKVVKEYSESAQSSVEQFKGKLVKKEDKELFIKITQLITEHIDDETLSLDTIAADLAISKMQLYRKIKDLSDYSPTELIRSIRLKHAEKLLKTTNKTVQEIMFNCGFNNKTYFYREFAKAYNCTPNKYRKS